MSSPSHIFVANSSVVKVHCDAFMCPLIRSTPSSSRCRDRPRGADTVLLNGVVFWQWCSLIDQYLKDGIQIRYSANERKPFTFTDKSAIPASTHAIEFEACDFHSGTHACPLVGPAGVSPAAGQIFHAATLTTWEINGGPNSLLPPRPVFVNVKRADIIASAPPPPLVANAAASGLDADGEAYLDGLGLAVEHFVVLALSTLRGAAPKAGRARHLLALPVLGTGGGGFSRGTAHVIQRIFDTLERLMRAPLQAGSAGLAGLIPFDAVLVCADAATFSMAQHIRAEREPASFRALLHPPVYADAEGLARLVTKGELSLFVGSGASRSAGLPDWFGLLKAMEAEIAATPENMTRLGASTNWEPLLMADCLERMADSSMMSSHNFLVYFVLSAAFAATMTFSSIYVIFVCVPIVALTILCEALYRYGSISAAWLVTSHAVYANLGYRCRERPGRSLAKRVVDFLSKGRHTFGLSLALVSAQPVKAIVTTNYDTLIEQASSVVGVGEKESRRAYRNLSVIPFRPKAGANRWLLKMHGCVTQPTSLILTTRGYQSYSNGGSRALAGLVQANLMTSHFLFLGFGLADPNYLRIVKEVQDALRDSQYAGSDGDKKRHTTLSLDPERSGSVAPEVDRDVRAVFVYPRAQREAEVEAGAGAARAGNAAGAQAATAATAAQAAQATAEAARRLEVFLDLVGLRHARHGRAPRHLLDKRFQVAGDPDDGAFRRLAAQLVADIDRAGLAASRGGHVLLETLESLGFAPSLLPPAMARSRSNSN